MAKNLVSPAVGSRGKQPSVNGRQDKRDQRSAVAPKGRSKEISVASRLPSLTSDQVQAAKKKFEQGIVTRNEASPAGTALHPGATHEVVGHAVDGSPVLKRKRFSIA